MVETLNKLPTLVIVLIIILLVLIISVLFYTTVIQGRQISFLGIKIYKAELSASKPKTGTDVTYIRYVKILSLGHSKYSRPISRLNREINIENESVWFNTVIHSPKPNFWKWTFRSGGVADSFFAYPICDNLHSSNQYEKIIDSYIEQKIPEESGTFVSVFHSYNGLGPGKDDIGLKLDFEAQKAILIVDFSSVPNIDILLLEKPKACFKREATETILDSVEVKPYVYRIISENNLKDDFIRMDFNIKRD